MVVRSTIVVRCPMPPRRVAIRLLTDGFDGARKASWYAINVSLLVFSGCRCYPMLTKLHRLGTELKCRMLMCNDIPRRGPVPNSRLISVSCNLLVRSVFY